ncbi:hypothetical protein LINPERPRIM_LOCUS34106 [Linum perenne]
MSKQKTVEGQINSEIAVLKSRSSAAEARMAAAHEQMRSAQEEAVEWKRKYDVTVRETKAALEKAAVAQERSSKETQLREDALREEFSVVLTDKVIIPCQVQKYISSFLHITCNKKNCYYACRRRK